MMVYAVPALIGIFWGAPLIARELETGTHRLVWNQSVTRTRWLATKLVIVGGAAAVSAGLLSWAVTTWANRIDDATGDRITPLFYGARGIVPIGYAIFAFTLGVTLGMLIRRTVPAMAATLAIYSFAAYSMQEWIREHLVSASHVINPLDISSPHIVVINEGNVNENHSRCRPTICPMPGCCPTRPSPPTGQVFTGPADSQYCGLAASGPSLRRMARQPRPPPRPHLPPRQPLLAAAVGRDRHLPRRRRTARRVLLLVDPPTPHLNGPPTTDRQLPGRPHHYTAATRRTANLDALIVRGVRPANRSRAWRAQRCCRVPAPLPDARAGRPTGAIVTRPLTTAE